MLSQSWKVLPDLPLMENEVADLAEITALSLWRQLAKALEKSSPVARASTGAWGW